MPLSDHEQRILAELEESLNREDPDFAHKVRHESLYRRGRHYRWAILSFVVGLAILVAFYSSSLLVGFLGVAIMFGSAVVFWQDLHRMSRSGWHDLRGGTQEREPVEARGLERNVHAARDWFKGRFRRDVD